MSDIRIDIHDEMITQKGLNAIIDFYNTLAINQRNFLSSIAFVTGINSPFLNVFFDKRGERIASNQLAKDVNGFFEKYNLPWGWFIMPADYKNDLSLHGFHLIEEFPSMYFDLLNPLPEIQNDAIITKEVKNAQDFLSWIEPINEGFQIEKGDDLYLKLHIDIFNKGEVKLRHFITYYKEDLAASGTLFLTDDAVMLHNIATKTAFRNLKLASSITLYMMKIAKTLGFKNCYLDASKEAFNLYKRLGFKVYTTTLIYQKTLPEVD